MRYITFAIISVLLFACSEGDKKSFPASFDLDTYLTYNIDSLQKNKIAVSKQIRLNDSSELVKLDSVNFNTELSVFKQLKWNPKQVLRYAVDSSLNGKRLRISYEAKEEGLTIRKMLIEKLVDAPDHTARVRVWRSIDKMIYSIDQELYFEPASGCYVKGGQSVPNVYDEEYDVYYLWR